MIKRYVTTFARVLLLTLLFGAAYADTPPSQPSVTVSFLESKTRASIPSVLLHLKEFPKNKEISGTIQRPLVKKQHQTEKFRINDQGKIVHQDRTEKEALNISAQEFLPGERVTAIFQTTAGDVLTTASFIPYPICDKTSDSSLAVSAELTNVEPANYELTIQGLQKGEIFVLRSQSGDEVF